MSNMRILTAVLGIVAPALTAWSAEESSAPAGELDLPACLVAPPGQAGELEARLAELNKSVAAAETPLDRATAQLATANWLVAVPTARPAIRWLVGLERPTDRRILSARGIEAQQHIEKARTALKSAGDLKGAERRKAADLRLAADALEPFASLFAVAAPAADTAGHKAAFAEAALGLSIDRESENHDLSACALLWQSFAWECAGRGERAIAALPSALVRPEQPEFDFLCRLLRCRLVAEDGLYTAAYALAVRVRASCEQWFSKEPPEELAARQRLAAIVQYRIGQTWLQQLRKSNSQTAADDLAATLAGLRDVLYENDQPGPAYVPETIVPILIMPKEVPGSAPATRSSSGPAVSKASEE